MTETRRFSCPACTKTFARVDHLKRHKRAHNASRPHKCTHCGKTYARLDVLKRHHQSCRDGLLRPVSEQAKTTRRDHAGLCSKFRAISEEENAGFKEQQDSPLSSIADTPPDGVFDEIPEMTLFEPDTCNQLTYYQSPSRPSPAHNALGPEIAFLHLSGNRSAADTIIVTQDPVRSFSFLLRFTADVEFTMAFEDPMPSIEELLDLGSPHNGLTSSDSGSLAIPSRSVSPEAVQDQTGFDDSTTTQCQMLHVGCISHSTAMTLIPACLDANSLIGKCLDIVASLKQIRCRDNTSTEHIGSNEAVAAQFFSPARLLSLLGYYWTEWHPNLPLLHRPLFSALSTPSALLAAMAVIGARYSSCSRDRHQSKALYLDVEELVFTHLNTVAGYSSGNHYSQRERVQALQAAYIVLVYQCWDGKTAARHKCRRQRFLQMIEAMQLIGIGEAKQNDFRCIAADSFDWLQYAEREELIRLFNWCFLIDAAFVTFYNLAPRLRLRELKMGLTSPDTCFEADSAAECLFDLQKWQYQTEFDSELTLYDFLKLFCASEMDFASQIRFAHHSTVSFFCIASAFHVMLFNTDPCIGPLSQYDPLLTGINNWRVVWNRKTVLSGDRNLGSLTGFDTKKLGFWKHCPEYWLLAYVLVRQIIQEKSLGIQPPSDDLPLRSGRPDYDESSQRKLHSFLQAYSCGELIV